jgi:GTP diphosphokinase / guanosine-3',5'-bis(diphosphate) 3'-diphosphatase
MTDFRLILKALEFASHRHRSQRRKGSRKIPYINHPIQVASLLANEGGETDPVLLTAAILHDVIEDTVESADERENLISEISAVFGDEILALTLEVTDDKTLEKKVRKQLQIDDANHKSVRAKKLKIADKITNLRDIIIDPPDWWSYERIVEYINWSEKVVAGLKGVNPELESLFNKTLADAREKYHADGRKTSVSIDF